MAKKKKYQGWERKDIEIIDRNPLQIIQYYHLKSIVGDGAICPICRLQLKDDITLIPVKEKMVLKVRGKACINCKCLYVNDLDAVVSKTKKLGYARGFTFDGVEQWKYFTMKKIKMIEEARTQAIQKMKEIPSAVVMICIYFLGTKKLYWIYISKEKCLNNPKEKIFGYGMNDGLEFLSAAFAEDRSKKGCWQGKEYMVKGYWFKNKLSRKRLHAMKPEYITIKDDGGYPSSVKNRFFELTDLLFYSPFSQRYEIVKATHDKLEGYYFIDVGIYRRFLTDHGKPPVQLMQGCCSFEKLNEESLLKIYGYSVAQKDNLSSNDRQAILAEVVDIQLLTVSRIVSHLNFCMSTHSQDKNVFARAKWREDLKFIESYKANPERFLIADKIKINKS